MYKSIYGKITSRLKRYYISLFNTTELNYKIHGIKLKLNFNKDVDKRLFINGFEKDVIDYFKKTVKEGDVVLDVGANIGIYSLIAGRRVGDNGKVYAFEPATKAFNILQYHIDLNHLKNITPIKSGVSNYTGEAEFNICEDDAYNSLGDTPMKEIIKKDTINIVSIDDFVLKNKINKVDIIKVDTEGAEFLVFTGAKKTLHKYKPVLLFETNPIVTKGFTNDLDDLLDLIRLHNYKLFEVIKGKLSELKLGQTVVTNEIIAINKNGKIPFN
jgi:FkbM family methyltransferase